MGLKKKIIGGLAGTLATIVLFYGAWKAISFGIDRINYRGLNSEQIKIVQIKEQQLKAGEIEIGQIKYDLKLMNDAAKLIEQAENSLKSRDTTGCLLNIIKAENSLKGVTIKGDTRKLRDQLSELKKQVSTELKEEGLLE